MNPLRALLAARSPLAARLPLAVPSLFATRLLLAARSLFATRLPLAAPSLFAARLLLAARSLFATRAPVVAATLLLVAGAPLRAQGVVVDEGRFAILIGGERAGTEEFSIRRAGVGRDDAVFANAVVSIVTDGLTRESRPLLRAVPPEGIAVGYQIRITGDRSLDIQMTRARGRYLATIRSDVSQEDREFQARPDTRVLDAGIAHHYYFLRNLSEGETAHVLEPTTRSHTELTAGAWTEEELPLGTRTLPARRVELSSGTERRIVWYDRFGHVLRVDIPARDYVAERIDLVG